MDGGINLDNISIVLHKTRYSENIGAVARAIKNMGLSSLLIVEPENYDINKVLKLSTHAALDIVEKIIIHESLAEALSTFNYVVGTTNRLGGQRKGVNSPEKIAEKFVPISQNNSIAILFGPEDRGLLNEEIRYCHALVTIPASDFSSLNLAQAVMIICYEIFLTGRKKTDKFIPRLASRHELDGMYKQLQEGLIKICYIKPENPEYWMNNLRHFFSALQLTAKEVGIIRGLCRQVNWYGKKRFQDGKKHER